MSITNQRRPLRFEDYLGQENIKTQLKIAIQASKTQKRAMKHTLLYGNPGLGKSTLAEIIANELGAEKYIPILSSNLTSRKDLINILASLSDYGFNVIFIDEIHNLSINIEEMLYSVMEDFIVEQENIYGQIERRWCPPFTLIGATTHAGKLNRPLRDRFGLQFELQNYSNRELSLLLLNFAKRNNINVTAKATREIAKRAKGVARIAIHYLEACRDYAVIYNNGKITSKMTDEQFELMGIDENGLTPTDYKFLRLLALQSRPIGISSIASAIDVDKATIETMVEPYLVQKMYVIRTNRGREITELGREVIGCGSGQTVDNGRVRAYN